MPNQSRRTWIGRKNKKKSAPGAERVQNTVVGGGCLSAATEQRRTRSEGEVAGFPKDPGAASPTVAKAGYNITLYNMI